MSELRPVILSGGAGTRLWPLSTPEKPKQFATLFGEKTLFGMTLDRLSGLPELARAIVVTGARHLDLVQRETAAAAVETVTTLVEPLGRNTAPAVLAAALVAPPTDVLVILPSDHLIVDIPAFHRAVGQAVDLATSGGIVTFGIEPDRPETGYGYIEKGGTQGPGFSVARFKEKPDLATAADMVADGRHLWNSGMFVARADSLVDEAGEHCPLLLDGVLRSLPSDRTGVVRLGDGFAAVESISLDHAIMEHTNRAAVVPIDVGWNDVGSYRALLGSVERDNDGNHVDGNVILNGVTGSFIKATSRKVAVAGVSDIAIVETPDAVLVIPLSKGQEVKDLQRRATDD